MSKPTTAELYLVEETRNPSSDYFVLPWLKKKGFSPTVLGLDQVPTRAELAGSHVVFVRYVTKAWRRAVTDCREQLNGLAYFIDDDVFDWQASQGLPARYRWKLFSRAARHQSWLRDMKAELWVSSSYLLHKYRSWDPTVIAPTVAEVASETPAVTVFYHGSASHRAEAEWLYPVMQSVLQADPRICFEIIGDTSIRARFRSLPRVHVLYPMTWQSYVGLLHRPGRDIGLAPMLDSAFNQSRSPIKFFDITLAGAVGIYASHPVFAEFVEDGKDGIVLDMSQDEWIEAILSLAQDSVRREQIHASAVSRLRID